jgi:hypothetical protein
MTILASVQFVQGITTYNPGQAARGVSGTAVTVQNGASNSGVVRWQFTVLDVPPGSSIPIGVAQNGATPTWSFTPDIANCYSIRLDVYDSLGNNQFDIRAFGVPMPSGHIIPPFGALASTVNFAGQTRGWSPAMEEFVGPLEPRFVADLATYRPTSEITRQVIHLDGYSITGDGGGGRFVWMPADTRVANGGTILGSGTGRWVRDIEGNGWSVRWFGATGLGSVDDGPAINNCALAVWAESLRIGQTNPALFQGPHVYVPRGIYKIGTTVEINSEVAIIGQGSGDQTVFRDDTNTHHLLRSGAFNNRIEGISFCGGKSAIVFWGTSVNYGDLTVTTAFGSTYIKHCKFRANAGASIWLDTGNTTRGSPERLIVDTCDFYTGSCFYGGFDQANFRNCDVQATQAPAGPSWAVACLDDSGNPLAIWNSYDQLEISSCFIVPQSNNTFPCYYAWQGTGNFIISNSRFGGETRMGWGRVTNSITYHSQTMASVSASTVPEIRAFNNSISSLATDGAYTNGYNLLEIRDQMPVVIDITQTSQNGTQGLIGQNIWIHSTTIPKSSYTNLDKGSLTINLDFTSVSGGDNLIRTGTDPRSADAENVTPYLIPYMTRKSWPRLNARPTAAQQKNLWPSGKQTTAGADYIATSNVSAGSAETATGYSLIPYTATAFPGLVSAYYKNITNSLARGLYTLSWHVLVNFNITMQVRFGDNAGTPNPLAIIDAIPVSASPDVQRLETVFYHDGSAAHSIAFTVFAIPFADSGNPVTGVYAIGGFKLEPGLVATDFTTSGAPAQDGLIISGAIYTNNAAPSTGGPYALGDVAWNSSPAATRVAFWVCTVAGSPGTWRAGPTL